MTARTSPLTADTTARRTRRGVLAVAVIGALLARFRPDGLARALVATALAQLLVGAVALIAGPGPAPPWDALVLCGFFAALWLLSAGLFRRAAASPRGASSWTWIRSRT